MSPASLAVLKADDLQNYAFKSESIVTIWRAVSVRFNSTTFSNNFVVDDIPSHGTFYRSQSNSFLLRDFAGALVFEGNTTFSDNAGILGSAFMHEFLHPSYRDAGYKSYIYNFDRFTFG